MDQSAIFGPVLATMLLTMLVWIYMYAKRIPFIRSLHLEPQKLTPSELARLSPPSVSNPSDNLKNLFEVPVLFYTLGLYLFVANEVDQVYVAAAWIFVAFRALHSAVHCTINIIMLRFVLYVISCACVLFMLLRSVIAYAFG